MAESRYETFKRKFEMLENKEIEIDKKITVDELKNFISIKHIPVNKSKPLKDDYVNYIKDYYKKLYNKKIRNITLVNTIENEIQNSQTFINNIYNNREPQIINSNQQLLQNVILHKQNIQAQIERIERPNQYTERISQTLNRLSQRINNIVSRLDISNRSLQFIIPPLLENSREYHNFNACPPHIQGRHIQNLIIFIICNPYLNDSEKFRLLLNCLYYRYKSRPEDRDHRTAFTDVYRLTFKFYSLFYPDFTREQFKLILELKMDMFNIQEFFNGEENLDVQITFDQRAVNGLINSYYQYITNFRRNSNQISNNNLINNLIKNLLIIFNTIDPDNFQPILTEQIIALGNHIINNESLNDDQKLRILTELPRFEFINNLIGHLIFQDRRLNNNQKLERLESLRPRADYIIRIIDNIVNDIAINIMNDQTLDFDTKLRRLQNLEPKTDYIKSTINDIIASNINNNDSLDNYQKLELLSRLQPITEYINNLINNIDGILIFQDRRLNNNEKLERLQNLQPQTDYINVLIANLQREQSPLRKLKKNQRKR